MKQKVTARAYYANSIDNFLNEDDDAILGALARHHNFALDLAQKSAWEAEIRNLKSHLAKFRHGWIFFEFVIPRMGKRVDVILMLGDALFVVEYKVGSQAYDRQSLDQVLDYALDLKNFHEGSHNLPIVPILVATRALKKTNKLELYEDDIAKPYLSNGDDLEEIIGQAIKDLGGHGITLSGFSESDSKTVNRWSNSGYKPTPTIVEAAQALYRGHNVQEISRSDASAKNLSRTSDCVFDIIEHSKRSGRKSICFVTGVPGAGKTLAGLNISTRRVSEADEKAVFLSGNGPLVKVLREALARDEVEQSRAVGEVITKKAALQKVSAFIQNIHHFRDEGLRSDAPPIEHVVVFDEAQRAWNQEHAEKFMVQKRGAHSFDMSEPEFLISLMDRRTDWSTIVCLVGGGQEINTGEAGISEWFNALERRFVDWDVYHSVQITDPAYNWGQDLESQLFKLNSVERDGLHLAVPIRSFRAEKLSEFVAAVIDGDANRAIEINAKLSKYPIALTRDIEVARGWLRSHARGTERLGLVASSGGMRLKPEGIHVKSKIDPANWFLNGKEDIRSSYYLEDVATEFDIQGLELDWVGVCWDADFRRVSNNWSCHAFKGKSWQNVNDLYRRIYLANAYRVLLTRARQGMVIFVPRGDESDHTRPPAFYDETFNFLKSCGIGEI